MPVSLLALVFLPLLALPVSGDILAKEIHVVRGPVQPALPPDASFNTTQSDTTTMTGTSRTSASAHPIHILIPSIGVNSPIVEVGVNARGEMDVPDGKTQNVGWYKYGTVPGDIGSAVVDAHVFAAFKKLKHAQVGDIIYVQNGRGETVEFKIISSTVYPRTEVPMEPIFTDASGSYLNLITCEGRYSIRDATYTHRRVVYAERVQ